MIVHATAREITGAGCVVVVLATLTWRQIRRVAGRAVATGGVLIAIAASALMWIALVEVARLLVHAVLR